MFFIGQNLKHFHMTNSHDLLLIKPSKYLLFGVYFWLHQRNAVYQHKLQRKPIVKEMQLDLNFHLPLIMILKNPIFFSSRVKISYQQLNFSQFYEQII